MDKGAWQTTVQRVAKSWARLKDCTRSQAIEIAPGVGVLVKGGHA